MTEPWRWYCRLDGHRGELTDRLFRDAAALTHRDRDCRGAELPNAEWAEAGHLVHVWRW